MRVAGSRNHATRPGATNGPLLWVHALDAEDGSWRSLIGQISYRFSNPFQVRIRLSYTAGGYVTGTVEEARKVGDFGVRAIAGRCVVAMGISDACLASQRSSRERNQGPISPSARISGHTTACGEALRIANYKRVASRASATPKRWKYSPAGSVSTTVLRPLFATVPACQIHRYRKPWKRITEPSLSPAPGTMERAGQRVLDAQEHRCWSHSVADVSVRVPKQRDGEALGVADRPGIRLVSAGGRGRPYLERVHAPGTCVPRG